MVYVRPKPFQWLARGAIITITIKMTFIYKMLNKRSPHYEDLNPCLKVNRTKKGKVLPNNIEM